MKDTDIKKAYINWRSYVLHLYFSNSHGIEECKSFMSSFLGRYNLKFTQFYAPLESRKIGDAENVCWQFVLHIANRPKRNVNFKSLRDYLETLLTEENFKEYL